eukprot:10594676-Alexandrium_andersonii.AAC.1
MLLGCPSIRWALGGGGPHRPRRPWPSFDLVGTGGQAAVPPPLRGPTRGLQVVQAARSTWSPCCGWW